MDIIGTGFGLTITTITLLALAGMCHLLWHIRDLLRELIAIQRKLASRLGVTV